MYKPTTIKFNTKEISKVFEDLLAQTKYLLTNTDGFAGPLRCAFLP